MIFRTEAQKKDQAPTWRRVKLVSGAVALLLAGNLQAQSAAERPKAMVAGIDTLPAWKTIFADPQWQGAGVAPLSLQAPSNVTFLSPPESTRMRLLWCKEFLLVRFDCQDQSIVQLPGSEGAAKQRDLPYFKADAVEVFLDAIGDGRMYMEFQFSPNGGVFDAIYFCTTTPHSGPDFLLDGDIANHALFSIKEWNLAGLQTAARVWPVSEGQGWSVIAAFPAKEIVQRLGKTEFEAGMTLRANFVRFNYYSGQRHPCEITNWAPVLSGCAHVSPAGMGTLVLERKN